MGGYISFGKCNSNYKYMLFYLLSQLVDLFLFQKEYFFQLGSFDRTLIPNHKLIQEMCNYIGIFFFSTILLIYENFIKRGRKEKDNVKISTKNISNFYTSELIYKDQLKRNISFIKIILIIFLFFLVRQTSVTFYKCGLGGLDFWMFEMFFIYIISSKLFGNSTYKHQKISVFFVLIICGIMKIIAIILIMNDSSHKIYKIYKILIPIGILLFIANIYISAYSSCKIKWLMDLKYISPNKLLIIYGLMGTIICGIAGTISTFVPCEDKIISFDEMVRICSQKITRQYNNKTNYYYDSFIVHHNKIFPEYGNSFYAFKNICLIIMKSITIFLVNLFLLLILKYLNPLFFVCVRFVYYFFVELINIITPAIQKRKIDNETFLDFFSQFFGIIGILVYIEFIELNFCDFNYNLKKNIINRSLSDSSIELDIKVNLKENENDDDLTSNSNDI